MALIPKFNYITNYKNSSFVVINENSNVNVKDVIIEDITPVFNINNGVTNVISSQFNNTVLTSTITVNNSSNYIDDITFNNSTVLFTEEGSFFNYENKLISADSWIKKSNTQELQIPSSVEICKSNKTEYIKYNPGVRTESTGNDYYSTHFLTNSIYGYWGNKYSGLFIQDCEILASSLKELSRIVTSIPRNLNGYTVTIEITDDITNDDSIANLNIKDFNNGILNINFQNFNIGNFTFNISNNSVEINLNGKTKIVSETTTPELPASESVADAITENEIELSDDEDLYGDDPLIEIDEPEPTTDPETVINGITFLSLTINADDNENLNINVDIVKNFSIRGVNNILKLNIKHYIPTINIFSDKNSFSNRVHIIKPLTTNGLNSLKTILSNNDLYRGNYYYIEGLSQNSKLGSLVNDNDEINTDENNWRYSPDFAINEIHPYNYYRDFSDIGSIIGWNPELPIPRGYYKCDGSIIAIDIHNPEDDFYNGQLAYYLNGNLTGSTITLPDIPLATPKIQEKDGNYEVANFKVKDSRAGIIYIIKYNNNFENKKEKL